MKRFTLYLLLALQVSALLGVYLYKAYGTTYPTYRLKTMPVDPRDLMRGDYMILRYEIGQLPETMKAATWQGQCVYTTLKSEGDHWSLDQVLFDLPADTQPFIRGRVENNRIVYDLEKYFVPEGKGNPLGIITVDVAIRPNGEAQIKQLYHDNLPWP
jgi:uncharacterized membrane-anchored protein